MSGAEALALAAGVRAADAGNRLAAAGVPQNIALRLGELATAAAQRRADVATLTSLTRLANAAAIGADVFVDVRAVLQGARLPTAARVDGQALRQRAGAVLTALQAMLSRGGQIKVTGEFYASGAQLKNDCAMWLQQVRGA